MMPPTLNRTVSVYSNVGVSKNPVPAVINKRKILAVEKIEIPNRRKVSNSEDDIHERVLSARKLQSKMLQNQLHEANQTIADLSEENRALRSVNKRLDSALAKHESTEAQLPKLLESHEEELRHWKTKFRNIKESNADLEKRLKQKDAIIQALRDQNNYFNQLNKNKNLQERHELMEQIEQLEKCIDQKDGDLKILQRNMELSAKSFRQHFLKEQNRTKEVLLKLAAARSELTSYNKAKNVAMQTKPPFVSSRDNKADLEDKPTATLLKDEPEKFLSPKIIKQQEMLLPRSSNRVLGEIASARHSSRSQNNMLLKLKINSICSTTIGTSRTTGATVQNTQNSSMLQLGYAGSSQKQNNTDINKLINTLNVSLHNDAGNIYAEEYETDNLETKIRKGDDLKMIKGDLEEENKFQIADDVIDETFSETEQEAICSDLYNYYTINNFNEADELYENSSDFFKDEESDFTHQRSYKDHVKKPKKKYGKF